jgi:hypothetical protein
LYAHSKHILVGNPPQDQLNQPLHRPWTIHTSLPSSVDQIIIVMQNLEAANTRSSVSLWGRSYLDNKTLLWSFGPDRVSLVPPKEDAYRFAPYKTNGSKYPLYAKVEMKDKKNNSLFANNKLQGDIYVAVSCIHALGKKEPDIHHPPTQE